MHVITYGETVQVGPEDYRFIRTSKVIAEETNVFDILTWLESLGVKNPDLTMVDFSLLSDSDI